MNTNEECLLMPDEITPALTLAEWRERTLRRSISEEGDSVRISVASNEISLTEFAPQPLREDLEGEEMVVRGAEALTALMGASNAALSADDPRKLLPADVAALNMLVRLDVEDLFRDEGDGHYERGKSLTLERVLAELEQLAKKIEALLPPEG